MATKKECDRCGKQWTPSPMTKDLELAIVDLSIPYYSSKVFNERDKVDQSYELCQPCARHIHRELEAKPTPTAAPGHRTHRDTPTAAVQREITRVFQGEPDE